MKKVKCYSVRLKDVVSISDKAYKIIAFDGSECIIPKGQVFGPDLDVSKSDAYWISAWILEQKNIQYSTKKLGWFNPTTQIIEPNFETIIEHHQPTIINPVSAIINEKFIR